MLIAGHFQFCLEDVSRNGAVIFHLQQKYKNRSSKYLVFGQSELLYRLPKPLSHQDWIIRLHIFHTNLCCSSLFIQFLLLKLCRSNFVTQLLPIKLFCFKGCSGVDFINCFAPYAKLSCLALNFCASKKLLKSWAQGLKVGRRGAKPIMKLTPDRQDWACFLSFHSIVEIVFR